jgi:alpha-galactosidase
MKNRKYLLGTLLVIFTLALSLHSCKEDKIHRIENGDLIIAIDGKLHTRIQSKNNLSTLLNTDFQNSEYIVVRGQQLNYFILSSFKEEVFSDETGSGTHYFFSGKYEDEDIAIEKELHIKKYDDFPNLFLIDVSYKNTSSVPLEINKWVNNQYCIKQSDKDTTFWSFQGSSSDARADWILPVQEGFYQENYLGMNNSDYGGGIPVTDIWRSDEGIAIGHTSLHPELVSLPVDMKYKKGKVSIAVEKDLGDYFLLAPVERVVIMENLVMLHLGVCFNSLQK